LAFLLPNHLVVHPYLKSATADVSKLGIDPEVLLDLGRDLPRLPIAASHQAILDFDLHVIFLSHKLTGYCQ
jgi:hypothetical protein